MIKHSNENNCNIKLLDGINKRLVTAEERISKPENRTFKKWTKRGGGGGGAGSQTERVAASGRPSHPLRRRRGARRGGRPSPGQRSRERPARSAAGPPARPPSLARLQGGEDSLTTVPALWYIGWHHIMSNSKCDSFTVCKWQTQLSLSWNVTSSWNRLALGPGNCLCCFWYSSWNKCCSQKTKPSFSESNSCKESLLWTRPLKMCQS